MTMMTGMTTENVTMIDRWKEWEEYTDPGGWGWIAGPLTDEARRLAKAAPDLLTALEFMVENCGECGGSGVIYDDDYWSAGPTGGPCVICEGARECIARVKTD